MVSAPGAVEFEELLVLLLDFFLAGSLREANRLFRGRDCLGESARLRVGGGERSDKKGLLIAGESAGPFGQAHGLRAVAQGRVGVRSQNPGQVVQGDRKSTRLNSSHIPLSR